MNAKPQPQKVTQTSALQMTKGITEFNILKQHESMRIRQTKDGKFSFPALINAQQPDPYDDYESP